MNPTQETPAGAVPGSTVTMAKALNEGLRKAMEDDPKVVIMGEDVGKLGGVFRITDGLQKDFGEDRVIDTPLAESAIIGTAVGLAMRGYRPVCEIQFDGFVFPGFDQIVSQVAKIHNRSAGLVRMPITIRIPFGGGIGAVEHHSESPEAYFAHTPGLKVVSRPSVPTTRSSSSNRNAATGARARWPPNRSRSTGPRSCAPVATSPSRRTGRWSPCASRRRPSRPRRGTSSRWSTCARCPRWTWRRSSSRCSGRDA
jgi:hypothetical protein